MRIYRFDEGLYVSGTPTVRDVDLLDELKVSVVVCVSKKPTTPEVTRGRTYLYRPLPDSKHPNLLAWWPVANEVETLLGEGERVLIHCLAGRNRSVFLAALVIASRRGWTGARTLRYVKQARPNSFHNLAFEEALLRVLPT